jgi:hypothetical protein
MNAAAYISFRKRTDKNFKSKFGKIMYATVIVNGLLMIMCCFAASLLLLAASIIAVTLLLSDMFIAVKYNLPINKIVNGWTTASCPENWQLYREKWLHAFYKRQVLNITGFVSLVAGAVFQ